MFWTNSLWESHHFFDLACKIIFNTCIIITSWAFLWSYFSGTALFFPHLQKRRRMPIFLLLIRLQNQIVLSNFDKQRRKALLF